ncbi:hypothetical protein RC1_1375 [Rhodospirillum centenum SW]|uniref:Uncharacterized protein n=1 Tax=Rhodospirillum centenum (strain ATCC 51521 / SW) TaxID=414684 RepID=B6IT21_RHOCS|nr:hypothetical protein RC1_1375 [Rhodospirillum centenum SW]
MQDFGPEPKFGELHKTCSRPVVGAVPGGARMNSTPASQYRRIDGPSVAPINRKHPEDHA